MQTMQQQRGFTLIELIIVIVILGILAVTAAPRFLDLSDDANDAAAGGVLGAVNAAADVVRAQWLVSGTPSNTTIDVDGTAVAIDVDDAGQDGYPTAAAAGIGAAVEISQQWQTAAGNTNELIFVGSSAATLSASDDGVPCVIYTLDPAVGAPVTNLGTFTFASPNTCS